MKASAQIQLQARQGHLFALPELPDGFELIADFMQPAEAGTYMCALQDAIHWRQDQVRVYGKLHRIPRLHQWYADAGLTYRWSGITLQPTPWLPMLAELRNSISRASGCEFNSVLANLYRNGRDSMGWHSDDETELGDLPVIASLSLGVARDFHLRRRQTSACSHRLLLTPGSLLIMRGPSQRDWQHALPKRSGLAESRLNLTFRRLF